jgi:hypothetical protein
MIPLVSLIRVLVLISVLLIALSNGESVRGNEPTMSMKDTLPSCLKRLLKATSFDDGVRGEGQLSENFSAYAEASSQVSGLEDKDLQYVLTHATAAGRIYAAVLLKESGRVGDAQSFGKLLHDDAKVTYLSGCKGAEYRVSEVADAFIKNGSFHNFRFSIFCKLKAPVSAADTPGSVGSVGESLATLMTQDGVAHYQRGDSNQPAPSWTAFQVLLKEGNKARPQADQLTASKHAGAKIYGAILLMQLDAASGAKLLKSWSNDKSPVMLSNGCLMEQSTVGALSQRILNGEQIVLLKAPQ